MNGNVSPHIALNWFRLLLIKFYSNGWTLSACRRARLLHRSAFEAFPVLNGVEKPPKIEQFRFIARTFVPFLWREARNWVHLHARPNNLLNFSPGFRKHDKNIEVKILHHFPPQKAPTRGFDLSQWLLRRFYTPMAFQEWVQPWQFISVKCQRELSEY